MPDRPTYYAPPGFGKRMRILLADANVTANHLAQELGFNHAIFTRINQGGYGTNITILSMICERLGASADWLLFGEGEMYREKKR